MNVSDFFLFYAKNGFLKPLRESCYRKFCRRNRGRDFLIETNYGSVMKIVIGDNVDNEIFINKYFERDTSELMSKLALHVDCFVDIGCNIGYYSCLFGKVNPSAKVYAIDPNPQMIERATENLKLSGVSDFKTFNCGVSSENDILKFYIPQRRHSLGSFIKPEKYLGEISIIDVPVSPLMNILEAQEIKNAVLKIDAEGYEWKILSGLSSFDMQKFDYVIFEFASQNIVNAENSEAEIFEIPWIEDYHVYSIQPNGSISPFSYRMGRQYSLNICMVRKDVNVAPEIM